jgi:tetratricopeptide (TPR) repeat protein
MTEPFETDRPDIQEMFERFRQYPGSHVFAPLADAYRKAKMLDEALQICDRGLTANPRYASGHVVHGKCLHDAGRTEDAEAAFRRVLDIDEDNLVALKYLGIIHAERGDAASARRYFEQILVLDPEDRDIRRRLEDVDEPPVAAAAARRAPEPPPRDDEDDNDRELFDLPDIEDDFEGPAIVLGDEPATSDDIATTTLADIYAAQGYRDRALRIYREVLGREPDNEAVRRKIATLEKTSAAPPEPPAAEPAPAARVPDVEAAPFPRPAAPDLAGSKIDESRSYEQFKRWLRSVSD